MARSNRFHAALVDIDCRIIRESPSGLAWLIDAGTGEKVWVPKSLCEYDEDSRTMAMPEHLAQEKGLI